MSVGQRCAAAAAVCHQAAWERTAVEEIAVAPEFRYKGYGTELMRHIAKMALFHGDTQIGLVALEPRFFSTLGFSLSGDTNHMVASPHDILASQQKDTLSPLAAAIAALRDGPLTVTEIGSTTR